MFSMTRKHRLVRTILMTSLAAAPIAACTGDAPVTQTASPPPAAAARPTELQTMISRFAPADISADVKSLPENERAALSKLIDAARLMDSLFLRQVWAGNDALLQRLGREALP